MTESDLYWLVAVIYDFSLDHALNLVVAMCPYECTEAKHCDWAHKRDE